MSVNDALWERLSEAERAELLAQYATRHPGQPLPLFIESFAALVAQEFPPLPFLVDGLIPAGQLVILGGRGKSGKSWLVLQLIAAIDRGEPFLGRGVRPGKVLYLALEDGRRRMNQRPKIMGWQPSRAIDIAFKVDKFGAGGEGIAHLRQAIADKGYDLVVIDTLVKTLAATADENNNPQMAAIGNDLADMAHDSGTCVLVVHHTSKQLVENPFDGLRGASAIRNSYDVGLMLVRKHGEKEATLHAEARDFDPEDITIRQVDNGAGWVYVGNTATGVAIRAGRVGVNDLLAAGEGSTAAEIAAATGKSEQTIRGTLKTAEKHGYVTCTRERVSGTSQYLDRWFLTDKTREK